MNLNPILDYLRQTVLGEIDMALEALVAKGAPADEIESGRRHRADVVEMIQLRHGPDAMASYLRRRADRLEGIPMPLAPDERAFVKAHAPWCRSAAKTLKRASVFVADPLAA